MIRINVWLVLLLGLAGAMPPAALSAGPTKIPVDKTVALHAIPGRLVLTVCPIKSGQKVRVRFSPTGKADVQVTFLVESPRFQINFGGGALNSDAEVDIISKQVPYDGSFVIMMNVQAEVELRVRAEIFQPDPNAVGSALATTDETRLAPVPHDASKSGTPSSSKTAELRRRRERLAALIDDLQAELAELEVFLQRNP